MPAPKFSLSNAIDFGTALIALIALIVSFYSIKIIERVESSDFQVSESTKLESVALFAALRSLMYKGIVHSDPERDDIVSIDAEKEVIQSFLLSPAALAFNVLASEKSKETPEGNPESWRIFFHLLNLLLVTEDPWVAAKIAGEIEITYFDYLTEEDFRDITEKNLSDLSKGFRQAVRSNGSAEVIFSIVREEIREREARGNTDFLLRLLRIKFGTIPENILAQVLAASPDQLDAWINKWKTAEDLDDIFGVD